MYSQNGEEAAILKAFAAKIKINSTGRFLDIGAFDGKMFSNTLKLTELGWTGVLVEPNPSSVLALSELYSGIPFMCVVNALIGEAGHFVPFFSCPDALSTTEIEHREKWANGGTKFNCLHMRAVTPGEFLSQFPGPYDFVNIDTEGTSTSLLFSMIPQMLVPKVVCVEHDGNNVEISNRARDWGYRPIYLDGNNLILERHE